jgi:hypothetical protein
MAEARPHGIHPGFSPDMGLALAKAGLMTDDDGKKFYHIITSVRLCSAAKIEDRVRAALSRQPYEHIFPPDGAPMMTLVGDIGDKVYTARRQKQKWSNNARRPER